MDGVRPEQVGPLLASNQIVLYELIQEGGDLESVFLSLTTGPRLRGGGGPAVMYALRAELLKMRSMPGVWVTWALAVPLTVLGCLGVFAVAANGDPGHALELPSDAAPAPDAARRRLRHHAGPGADPRRPVHHDRVPEQDHHDLADPRAGPKHGSSPAKVVVVALWSIFMVVLSLVTVAAVGLALERRAGRLGLTDLRPGRGGAPGPVRGDHPARPLRAGLRHPGQEPGGRHPASPSAARSSSRGSWSRLARAIFHYDLNWLPNGAGGALAGDIARGFGSAQDATTRVARRGGRADS